MEVGPPRRCCAIARLDEIPSCCRSKRKKNAKKYDCKNCRRRKKGKIPQETQAQVQTCEVFGLLGESLLRDWMQRIQRLRWQGREGPDSTEGAAEQNVQLALCTKREERREIDKEEEATNFFAVIDCNRFLLLYMTEKFHEAKSKLEIFHIRNICVHSLQGLKQQTQFFFLIYCPTLYETGVSFGALFPGDPTAQFAHVCARSIQTFFSFFTAFPPLSSSLFLFAHHHPFL